MLVGRKSTANQEQQTVLYFVCLVVGVLIGTFFSAYVIRRLIRLDEWTNGHILEGNGKETMSSRGGKAIIRKLAGTSRPGDVRWCLLCKTLDFLQRNHCVINIQQNVGDPVDQYYFTYIKTIKG